MCETVGLLTWRLRRALFKNVTYYRWKAKPSETKATADFHQPSHQSHHEQEVTDFRKQLIRSFWTQMNFLENSLSVVTKQTRNWKGEGQVRTSKCSSTPKSHQSKVSTHRNPVKKIKKNQNKPSSSYLLQKHIAGKPAARRQWVSPAQPLSAIRYVEWLDSQWTLFTHKTPHSNGKTVQQHWSTQLSHTQ